MKTYSNSKLSCFEQCRLKYKYAYIDKLKTSVEETVEAFMGKRVHEALEKLYKDLKFAKIDSKEEIIAFYNSSWEKNWNDAIVIVRKEYNAENYRKIGEKAISEYYERYKPFDSSKTIGLETTDLVSIGDYKLHVRIDRLAMNGTLYEIHDYKTANSLPTQEKVDSDRQLAIYAYGVRKMYPDATSIKLIWHYVVFDKEMVSERSDEELEQMKSEVLSLIKEIEECSSFPANKSALCDWCEFRPECPEWKHLFSLEEKSAQEFLDDDGVKLVNEFSKLKKEVEEKSKRLDEIKSKLVEFAKEKGVDVVFGSEVKASIRKYPRLSFPKKNDANREEFFEALRKIGLWDKLAAPDVYELAKMINKGEVNSELVGILEEFIKRGEVVMVRVGK